MGNSSLYVVFVVSILRAAGSCKENIRQCCAQSTPVPLLLPLIRNSYSYTPHTPPRLLSTLFSCYIYTAMLIILTSLKGQQHDICWPMHCLLVQIEHVWKLVEFGLLQTKVGPDFAHLALQENAPNMLLRLLLQRTMHIF